MIPPLGCNEASLSHNAFCSTVSFATLWFIRSSVPLVMINVTSLVTIRLFCFFFYNDRSKKFSNSVETNVKKNIPFTDKDVFWILSPFRLVIRCQKKVWNIRATWCISLKDEYIQDNCLWKHIHTAITICFLNSYCMYKIHDTSHSSQTTRRARSATLTAPTSPPSCLYTCL